MCEPLVALLLHPFIWFLLTLAVTAIVITNYFEEK